MREREQNGEEAAPVLHEFEVFYELTLTTWMHESKRRGRAKMSFEIKPVGEERRELEREMEKDFIKSHANRRGNIADISYEIYMIRRATQNKGDAQS